MSAKPRAEFTAAQALAFREEIRSRELRATTSRVAVLWALRASRAPKSHGDVAATLSGFGLDRATVYRNLLDLTGAGLARRTDLGDHVWRFEAVRPGRGGKEHPHFLCDACGTVTCLDDLKLVFKSRPPGLKTLPRRDVAILVKGKCDDCA